MPKGKVIREALRKAGVLAGGALSLGTVGAGGLMMHVGLSKAEKAARRANARRNVASPTKRAVKQVRLKNARKAETRARGARNQRRRFQDSRRRK